VSSVDGFVFKIFFPLFIAHIFIVPMRTDCVFIKKEKKHRFRILKIYIYSKVYSLIRTNSVSTSKLFAIDFYYLCGCYVETYDFK